MKVLKQGIAYELANEISPENAGQILQFAFEDAEGTAVQEVIRAAIDHLYLRLEQVPTQNYRDAIMALESAHDALSGKLTGAQDAGEADPQDIPAPGAPEGPDVVHTPEP